MNIKLNVCVFVCVLCIHRVQKNWHQQCSQLLKSHTHIQKMILIQMNTCRVYTKRSEILLNYENGLRLWLNNLVCCRQINMDMALVLAFRKHLLLCYWFEPLIFLVSKNKNMFAQINILVIKEKKRFCKIWHLKFSLNE